MSDWVHCNKCSLRYSSNSRFFLVECGHIFCQRCVERIKISKTCSICNKTGQVIALTKDLDQNVLDYFLPPETVLKKALEAYKFQLQHRNTLFQNLMDKYNYAKKEYIATYNTSKHLMKENHMLRSMLRGAGQNPKAFATSTPISQSSENKMFPHNASLLSSIPPYTGGTNSSGDNQTIRINPGYARRNNFFNSGSSQGPSPAQMVPIGHRPLVNPTPVHRINSVTTMRSLEELRRGGKVQ